jgi:uncharacterized protein (TIGR02246 family)
METWAKATRAGDIETILTLMTEDALFLTAGNPPIRGRQAFADSFKSLPANAEIDSEIHTEEIHISGDIAYAVNRLRVSMKMGDDGGSRRMTGYVLTIFRKGTDGRWALARDANMLTPES